MALMPNSATTSVDHILNCSDPMLLVTVTGRHKQVEECGDDTFYLATCQKSLLRKPATAKASLFPLSADFEVDKFCPGSRYTLS